MINQIITHIILKAIPATKLKVVGKMMGIASDGCTYQIRYNVYVWLLGMFNSTKEAGRAFAYARELLGIQYFGSGWDRHSSVMNGNIVKEEIVESNFICAVSGQDAVLESGPYQLSCTASTKNLHTFGNCRIAQLWFNTHELFSPKVYEKIFCNYEDLNRQNLHLIATTDDYKANSPLNHLACNANKQNKSLGKYFDEPDYTSYVTKRKLNNNQDVVQILELSCWVSHTTLTLC
jgi:hypothetical protein